MIAKVEPNSSESDFFSGDTAATYKLSDISLAYDTIFDKSYAIVRTELYTRKVSFHPPL